MENQIYIRACLAVEETSLQATITGLLDASEVILPEKPWHSIRITYLLPE